MYERIPIPEALRPFVSDFRIVADYFVQVRRDRAYVPSYQTVEHVDAVLRLLSALTWDHRFEEAQPAPGSSAGSFSRTPPRLARPSPLL